MAQLRLRQITKRYSGKRSVDALKPVDLDISDGEFVTILGPSGSGKTTLLSIIVGIIEPTSGHVALDDTDITHADPRDRDMAMVFQNYALYPSKTVAGNLRFPLRMQKTPRPERARRVRDMTRLLGLEEYAGRYPRELSGGQQQRVALGRALIRQPKLFLMDEPLSNLDAKLRLQMRTEIKRLHREYPVTTIYVTHDQSEAMALSDRVVVMNQGSIAQIGTPRDIFEHPADSFVAGFVGTPAMNVLPVTLTPEGPTITITATDGTRLGAIGNVRLEDTGPRQADLGIRPTHIIWSDQPTPDAIPATINEVDTLGEDTLVHTQLADEAITITERHGRLPEPGQTIHLTLPAGHLHLFDQSTGQALTTPTTSSTATQQPTTVSH